MASLDLDRLDRLRRLDVLTRRAGLQHIELARISQEVTEAPPGPDQIFSAASLLTYQQKKRSDAYQ